MRRAFEKCLFRYLGTLGVVSLFFLVSIGSESIVSEAKPELGEIGCDADVGIINGEPDAGVRVTVPIRNIGKSGVIEIRPRISTSEGEWSRSQTLQFEPGEAKRLSYFFHEPTINATGIHCYVKTIPAS